MATSQRTTEADVTRPRPKPLYQWFTTCPENWFILVVRGEDLHKVIHSVDEWDVNEDHEFVKGEQEMTEFRELTGRSFVGLPPFQGIFVYPFAWNKFWRTPDEKKPEAETPEYRVIAHQKENVFMTPFVAQYPLMYGGIDVVPTDRKKDDQEAFVPITLTIAVRVRMTRPKIALMDNLDWFGQVLTPKIQEAVKDWAGEKPYNWMISKARKEGSPEFKALFMSPSGGLNNYGKIISENAGVDIIDIGITDVQPNKEFEDALFKQAVAERTKRATITEAEGRKEAKILDGQAEKEYQKLVGEGNAARILAEVEAELLRIQKTSVYAAGGAGHDAAMQEIFRHLHGSGITTYVAGDSKVNPSILIGADGRPLAPAA